MTYEQAREAELFMPDMKYMRTKVVTYNGGESYFVDYVPDFKSMKAAGMSFGGMGMGFHEPMRMEISMLERHNYFFDNSVKHIQNPPAGRTQKQHNLIQTMNKGKRKWN